jgi:hypothetical protein
VQLLAAGFGPQRGIVLRWADFGLGPARDLAASPGSILHLLPLPQGGAAFAAADPGWGVVDPDGTLARAPRPPLSDAREARGGLAVSADGRTIKWPGAQGRLRFELDGRGLVPARGAGVASSAVSAPGLSLADWRDSPAPKLNGQALALGRGEISRSAAIAGDRLLLGTDTHRRLFDRRGRQLPEAAVTGAAWALAVAPAASVAVAALGDGTSAGSTLTARGRSPSAAPCSCTPTGRAGRCSRPRGSSTTPRAAGSIS